MGLVLSVHQLMDLNWFLDILFILFLFLFSWYFFLWSFKNLPIISRKQPEIIGKLINILTIELHILDGINKLHHMREQYTLNLLNLDLIGLETIEPEVDISSIERQVQDESLQFHDVLVQSHVQQFE